MNESAQAASDRHEIADALYRYAAGLDDSNAQLLASAFTEDCVLDFRPAADKLGLEFDLLEGREALVATLSRLIGPLDTSHTASNLRIQLTADSATLDAYMLSQHFLPKEGPRRGGENALLMNRYQATLTRDGSIWRIAKLTIDNLWAEGDPTILLAMASLRASRSQTAKRS